MKNTDDDLIDVNALAKMMGLSQYPVRLSDDLIEKLRPNTFLSELGIQYTDRINNVLSLLKGNLTPDNGKDTLPKDGINIPMTFVSGPYIREKYLTIKAEITDDNGEKVILLTAVLETE